MRGTTDILFYFLLSFQPCRDDISALWNYGMMELWHFEYFQKVKHNKFAEANVSSYS